MNRGIRAFAIISLFTVTGFVILQSCGSDSKAPAIADMSKLASGLLPNIKASSTSASAFSLIREAFAATGFSSSQERNLQGSEAFNVYRSFADPALDPAYPDETWGVENVRNNLDIAAALHDVMAGSTTSSTTVTATVHGNAASATVSTQKAAGSAATSPYPFSNLPAGLTYSTAVTAAAMGGAASGGIDIFAAWKVTDAFYMLTTYVTGGDKHENTVIEGQYNSTTNALRLNRASRVIESDGNFITHMELAGNTSTDEFTLKMAKQSTGTNGMHLSLAGKGISSGSGHYYVMKIASCGESATCLTSATPSWYCISSSALFSDWETFIADGTHYVDVAGVISHAADHMGFTGDCATYAAALDDSSMALLTDTDLPDIADAYASTLGL